MIFKVGVVFLAILVAVIAFLGIDAYNKCTIENKKVLMGKNRNFLIALSTVCVFIVILTFFVDIR
jgi:hypothetical protein